MILWHAFLFVLTIVFGGILSINAGSGQSSMPASLSDGFDDLESPKNAEDSGGLGDSASVFVVVDSGESEHSGFGLSVVKSWSPGVLQHSSSSVSSDDDEGATISRRKSADSYSVVIDQIHNLRSRKHEESYLLDGYIDFSEYEKQSIAARQSFSGCYELLIKLRNVIESTLLGLNPVDDRMCRPGLTRAVPEHLRRLTEGYSELCSIYLEYLRSAFNLGLGIIVSASIESRILEEPQMFASGLCGSCMSIWHSADFNCANCGVSMFSIPEEAFFDASCNLLRLVKKSEEFRKTTQICLDELQDVAL